MDKIPIKSIKINDRFRRDIGLLQPLIESIKKNGLIQPIVITSDNMLIAGHRRLLALGELGWTEVPVHIIKPDDIRLAEADENRVRLDLSPSEAVAVANYFKVEERAKAKERKKAGKKIPSEKFSGGLTRDKLASRVGMSGVTLEKATAVVEAAEAEPEKYGQLVEEMDKTGKVDPAYKQLQKSTKPIVKYPLLEHAKKVYLDLETKERKMFRKWLKTVK